MNQGSEQSDQHKLIDIFRRWWILLPVVSILLVVAWFFGPTFWEAVQDRAAIQAFVVKLGWMGPIALILLNGLQIVFAPIPGYIVQLTAGYLFGPIWGGIWGTLGLYLGATIAMWLARTFGRPLAQQVVGAKRLANWEQVTFSTNTIVWCIMLLGPTGDIPFYLAGLSRVSFAKILIITSIVRVPSVFVASAAGAGVMLLTWWQLLLLFSILGVFVLIFFRYRTAIMNRIDRQMQQRISQELQQDGG